MVIFKESMLNEVEQIKSAYTSLHELECIYNDDLYKERWDKVNFHFKWFLIRMEQWLGGIDCTLHDKEEIYDLNIQAQRRGSSSGFYWNRDSKKLFKMVIEGEM